MSPCSRSTLTTRVAMATGSRSGRGSHPSQRVGRVRTFGRSDPRGRGLNQTAQDARGRLAARGVHRETQRGEVSRMLEKLAIWASKSFARVEELRSEEGQALVEYALILALIAVVSIGALTALGVNVATQLGNIATAIGGA